MNWLRIRCFAQLNVTVNGVPLHDLHRSPTLQALLGYFVLHRDQTLARWQVAGAFWPEKEDAQARRALNTLLWRFQQVGNGCLAAGLHLSRHTVRWSSPPGCWIDVVAFETLTLWLEEPTLHQAAPEETLPDLQQAVQIYRGPLLANMDAEWCVAPRAFYHERYVLALEWLITGYEQIGQPETALVWAQRLVEAEPYQESGHRALVRLNLALNRPAKVQAAYQRYAHLWQEELGLPPTDLIQQEASSASSPSSVLGAVQDHLMPLLALSHNQRVPEIEAFGRRVVQSAEHLAEEAESAGRWAVARQAYEMAWAVLLHLAPNPERRQWELTLRLRGDRVYDLMACRSAQRENLCRALRIAQDLNDTAAQSEVCARLCWVAQREGKLSEAIQWAQAALDLAGEDRRLRAQALRLLGSSYEMQGDYLVARDYHERALAQDEQFPEWRRLDHLNLCSVYTFAGNDWKALEHAQAALALIPETPPNPLKALALGNLANVERILGDYDAAIRHVRQAQAVANMLGAQELKAWLAGRAAHLYAQIGEIAHARLWATQAWNLSTQASNITAQVEAGLVLGYTACLQGNLKTVRDWYDQLEPLQALEGGRRYRAAVLILKTHVHLLEGQYALAQEAIVQALAELERSGEERRRVACLALLAVIAHAEGCHSAAKQYVAEARAALLDRVARIPNPIIRNCFCTATPLRRFLLADQSVITDVERVEDGELLVTVGRSASITRAAG
nr:tetratricopeptide repeat protein [Ardenticatena sp.]